MTSKEWTAPSAAPLKTMICLILDRSGSMGGRESDVVGGVNKFLYDQKLRPEPADIQMVRFDSGGIETFRPMAPLPQCMPLNIEEYVPRGGTPLLDAIGKTLVQLDNEWRRIQPDRAILVIVTDGEENESREYKKHQIKSMIQSRQNSGKWGIIYLGADVDAFAEASSLGVLTANIAGYRKTSAGINVMYSTVSDTASAMRGTGNMCAQNLGKNLGEESAEPFGSTFIPDHPTDIFTPTGTLTPHPDVVEDSTTWSAPE